MVDIIQFPQAEDRRHAILVVDDEPVIRAVITDFLKDCGFDARAVGSGDAARDLIRTGVSIDLVFSDVRMPGDLDGYGLARWILENHPEIPVVLVSGDLGKANAASELCGVEFFAKPYDFQSAAKKIRETITSHRQRRA